MSLKDKSMVFDIDDTICFTNHNETDTYKKYGLAKPNNKIISIMQKLKAEGWYITLLSARRMLTHNGNIEMVKADVGDITTEWLKQHNVPYDNIHFGKPYASHYYIDDKGINLDDFIKEFQ